MSSSGAAARTLGHALGISGLVAFYWGDADPGPAFAASLTAFQQAEDAAGIALARLRLGLAALAHGELPPAEAHLAQALAEFRALGAVWGTATTLASLGDLARARAEWSLAAQHYREALEGYRRFGSKWYIASSLAALGGAYGMVGDDVQAAQLHGASAALFESIGMQLHDLDRTQYAAGFAAARERLGAARYEALYASGRAMAE